MSSPSATKPDAAITPSPVARPAATAAPGTSTKDISLPNFNDPLPGATAAANAGPINSPILPRNLALAPTATNQPVWNAATQQLARDNGWNPTQAPAWNDAIRQLATANGWSPLIDDVPATTVFQPLQAVHGAHHTVRTAAQELAYLKKGGKLRHNGNQKPAGQVKVHYGRRTFQRQNGPITISHLRVLRGNHNTRDCDNIYLLGANRPTDQIRHAEFHASAMDSIPVIIDGHRFHFSKVAQALEVHAAHSHARSLDAIAAADGHGNAANVGYL